MTPPRFFDQRGREVLLAGELKRGGEGAVYEVAGTSDVLAKLYLQPPSAQKSAKLTWMAAHAAPELLKFAAWPTSTLHARPGGPALGFVMPRVRGYKEVHLLYSPQSRRREFPSADLKFLLHTAVNCASAFSVVHAQGHLVGDVNEGNLLVSPRDATVRLIDCDSFQVRTLSQVMLCEVGVPLFTPPELQGHAFGKTARTPNHDHFGLAVLLFQLLFVGRHPFSGRFLGQGTDMPPERAIREFRFAYGQGAARAQMEPPPFSPPLAFLPVELGALFERAFNPGAISGGRPSATEWRSSLAVALKGLVSCPKDAAHSYPYQAGACPWCRIESSGGPVFFAALPSGSAAVFVCRESDLDGLWAQLAQVPTLSLVAPSAPLGLAGQPLPADVSASIKQRTQARLLGAASGITFLLALTAVTLVSSPLGAVVLDFFACGLAVGATLSWQRFRKGDALKATLAGRQAAFEHARTELTQARTLWAQATAAGEKITQERQHLDILRAQYKRLQSEFDEEMQQLQRNREADQRVEYLRRALIYRHTIRSIGPGRKATLRSYGFESAYDVLNKRLEVVPGFGPGLSANLRAWANGISSNFRFDHRKGVNEQTKLALVAKYQSRQVQLRGAIDQAISQLQAQTRRVGESAAVLARRLKASLTSATQAELDLAQVTAAQSAPQQMPSVGSPGFWKILGLIAVVVLVLALGKSSPSPSRGPPLANSPLPLTTTEPPAPVSVPVVLPTLSIARDCPLRVRPSAGAEQLGLVRAKTRVEVAETRGGWRLVVLDNGLRAWTGPLCWQVPRREGEPCRRHSDCASFLCSSTGETEVGVCLASPEQP